MEGCGLECEKEILALDISPWGEPINPPSPGAVSKEMGFSEKEMSKWVRKKIEGFSKFLGMPCDKFEKEIMVLFASIEANHIKHFLSKGFPCRSPQLTPKG